MPSTSSQATRLLDCGHSAWWSLFNRLPFAGPIRLLVQMCPPGEPGANRYGPAPGPQQPVPDAAHPPEQA